MPFGYLRIRMSYLFLGPLSRWWRTRRMAEFRQKMDLREGMTVLDLGGQPMIWDLIEERLKITILNLPSIADVALTSRHDIQYVEGNACDCPAFQDKSFDIVFSNSCIEHVGDANQRRRLAHEAARIGKGFWIQTPSKVFPVEAHTGMPFWWFYPEALRGFFVNHWKKMVYSLGWR